MSEEKQVSIQNCVFTGVVWDKQATEAVSMVAKALLNLTELFSQQNIKIDSLLTVENGKEEIKYPTQSKSVQIKS